MITNRLPTEMFLTLQMPFNHLLSNCMTHLDLYNFLRAYFLISSLQSYCISLISSHVSIRLRPICLTIYSLQKEHNVF